MIDVEGCFPSITFLLRLSRLKLALETPPIVLFMADPAALESSSTSETKMIPVLLKTKTTYQIPSETFMLPLNWRRYHLSQLINKVLDLPEPVPFDFIVGGGELLSGSVGGWCREKGVSEVCIAAVSWSSIGILAEKQGI